jgi:multicomponent Na+:H+ antiporter subunit A
MKPKRPAVFAARLSALLPLLLFTLFLAQVPVGVGEAVVLFWQWAPSIGITLDLAVDGLSVFFGLIISGIAVFVVLFAADYMGGHHHYTRFFVLLHLFLFAMLGLVLADNLIALFVFWELTTVFSFLLIGFDSHTATARQNARQALMVTGAGGLVLLIGFLLIGSITGTYQLSQLWASGRQLQQTSYYLPILAAVFVGAFTKSAQWPFHFWLPNAMAAPAPVSAFLHSATMVKAGIYLLARFHPLLGGTYVWMGTLVIVGGMTALWGAVLAIGQTDLKRMLAYTTMMALGILSMFLGGQTTPALTAAVTFLLVHALYKAALFMAVGSIDHETGTREIIRLGNLLRTMPLTGLGTAAAAMSMAGFPLFLGFIGKEIMYKGALTEDLFPGFTTMAAVLANALMAGVAGIIVIRPFLSRRSSTPKPPREAPLSMWVGPAVIGALGLVFGIYPDQVGRLLVQPAVAAFHPTVEHIPLNLFHGFNAPLLLSILTMALGTFFYLFRRRLRQAVAAIEKKIVVTGDRVYTLAMAGTANGAKRMTLLLQNGSLHRYLLTIIGTFIFATVAFWFINAPTGFRLPALPALPFAHWLLAALMGAAVVVVVSARSRLLAVCALGIVGTGAALIFLLYGAPDLALTQLLVETLTLIIVSIVLLRLPPLMPKTADRPVSRRLDALVAMAAGVLFTALVLTATGGFLDLELTRFYENNSVLAAHGRNIVNVILVDFRSLDTLGEIVVVAAAGLGGFALIVKRRS